MLEIDRGFLILNPQWWNDITISNEARNTFFKLLYSCISRTSHSLFIYYSVTLHEDENHVPNCILNYTVKTEPADTDQGIYSRMTYKHINSIIRAYEIALDVIELLDKIPTFDIRFIPVKSSCLNHILKTIGSSDQLNHWLDSYTFCEKNGNLIYCADIINSVISSFVQDKVYYLKFLSKDESVNSLVCSKFFDQLIIHGFPYFEVLDETKIPKWNNKLNVTTNNDDKKFIENPVNRTLFAGTFDRLHPGHKVNITVATWYAKEMAIIGITDTSLIINKRDNDILQVCFICIACYSVSHSLQDFSIRSANVLSFIFSLCPEISITLLRISSIIGGADVFKFDALIATPESFKNAKKINIQRLNKGYPLVQLVEVPFVYKPQLSDMLRENDKAKVSSEIITSTELRFYLKKNLDGSNNRLLLKDTIKEWFLTNITLDGLKSHPVGLINLVNSFIDDIIFEILHMWKKLHGNEKGKHIFEKWINKFISDISFEGKKHLNAIRRDKEYIKLSESITVVLVYLIVTLNSIGKNDVVIPIDTVDKMCTLFFGILRSIHQKDYKSCDHPEYCIPYMYCHSEVEKNIFFEKSCDSDFRSFKLKYESERNNPSASSSSHFNICITVDEDYFISFGLVLRKILNYFQLKEIERTSLFQ